MKSEYAKIADALLVGMKPFLKSQNFKTRGRTFNRITEDGLIQVINLQMGPSDPPGTTYHAGLRENLHGFFTINLGVHVPEVYRYHGSGLPIAFLRECHCCIRQRLGNIGPEKEVRDVWWPLSGDGSITSEIQLRIKRDAIPFLERFSTREKILSELGDPIKIGNASSPPRIVKAIILAGKGNDELAHQLLEEQSKETHNPQHSEYVRSLAAKLGITI